MWVKICFSLFLIFWVRLEAVSQELNATVSVNTQVVQSSGTRVFEDMENSFTRFLNETKWTEDEFQPRERINCNFVITIEEVNNISNFKATVQVQSSRPVYNTNYESLMFQYADRQWQFQYVESQPLDFNRNTYINEISSLLAYYAYIIIGIDYDSFSELGGEPYFEEALNIVNLAQQNGQPGWDQFGDSRKRNRFWLVDNYRNGQLQDIRKGWYTYHRKGLDTFYDNPEGSRKNILSAIEPLVPARKVAPQSILIISYLDAKTEEMINIFSQGGIDIRRGAYNVLTGVDPTNTEEFKTILEN